MVKRIVRGMETRTERNPYHSYASGFAEHFANNEQIARLIRMGDSRKRLEEMVHAEPIVVRCEEECDSIDDRIARRIAVHRLNMDYLIQFGVRADERHAFREVLADVALTGERNLYESAERARLIATMNNPDSRGCFEEGSHSSPGVVSHSAMATARCAPAFSSETSGPPRAAGIGSIEVAKNLLARWYRPVLTSPHEHADGTV